VNLDVHPHGDGGADFDHGINVKATPYIPERFRTGRVHLLQSTTMPHWSRYYVLTVVSLGVRRGAVFGWAHGRELRPRRCMTSGTVPSHAIPAEDLHKWKPR
jgi:hypothetical protein